jgi:hypothetical protein
MRSYKGVSNKSIVIAISCAQYAKISVLLVVEGIILLFSE